MISPAEGPEDPGVFCRQDISVFDGRLFPHFDGRSVRRSGGFRGILQTGCFCILMAGPAEGPEDLWVFFGQDISVF